MILLQAFRYLQDHHPYQAWSLLLFVALITSFYALSILFLLHILITRQQAQTRLIDRFFRRTQKATVVLAALGIMSLLYAWLVEPYWLEVTHINLSSSKLPQGATPITIAQISDLHCNAHARMEGSLPGLIAAENPDLIVFTGDAINNPLGIPVFRRLMSQLSKLAPTFAVAGNWEVYWHQEHIFDGTGVKELNVNAVPLKISGQEIWIAGVPANHQECNLALQAVPQNAFTVFLDHYPDGLEQLTSPKVDLYLCGHTHGGQVALPFYGAIVTFSNQGKRYEAGLYKRHNMFIYVNRGIGMDPEPFPQLRFFARPEITVFKISPP